MRRRLGTPLLGLGGTVVFMAFVGYMETGVIGGLALTFLAIGAGALVIRWILGHRRPETSGWSPTVAVAFEPAAPHQPAPAGRVAVALSTVEAREQAVSAALGVGIGFCLLVLILFGLVWSADWGGNLPQAIELYPLYAHPFVGMVVIAAHRARTRSRRDDTQELFEACPTDEATRTLGHLLTAWLPALALLLFAGLMTLVTVRSFEVTFGELGARQVAAVLGTALLGVGGTALGVALARWTPWMLAPIVALIAIAFGSIRLATTGGGLYEPVRQLSTWLGESRVDLRFTAPGWLAHHLWILGLVVAVGVLALARDRRTPRVAAVGAVAVVVAVASAVAATRPIDIGEAERIASLLNDRDAHQRCVADAGLPICVYVGDEALARHLADEMSPVVAAAPQGAVDGWVVRYGADVEVAQLDPEVRALLSPRTGGERLLPIEVLGHRAAEQAARFWVALAATGILDSDRTSLSGQARGVVALWLATRGADEETVAKMTSVDHIGDPGNSERARPWPDPCMAGSAPVSWAVTDVEAARHIVAAPEASVRAALHREWARLMDPTTSTDDLLRALGLEPLGPPVGTAPERHKATC